VSRSVRLLFTLALVVAAVTSTVRPAGAADLPRTAARRAVERSVHEAYPDLTFGNVACPTGVERKRGVAFTCTVQLPGTFLIVDATQTDGSGTIDLTTQQALIPTQSLRDFVAQNASLPATVDCGPSPFRVARAGQSIECATTLADGTARSVQLTVQDTAGNVTITAVT
jgi:Domain of unknown function (DUF4333)